MVEQLLVITIVTVAAGWLLWRGYRYFRPRAGGGCGGSCCSAAETAMLQPGPSKPPEGASAKQGEQIVLSEDLRNRVRSRR